MACLTRLAEDVTGSVEIASLVKFSEENYFILQSISRDVTLLEGGEEGDRRELAVALLVEAGHLDHVLRVGCEVLQTGSPVPLTRGQLGRGHSDLAPVCGVYRLQHKVLITSKL